MALIQINGVDIPTPSEYTVGIMDLSKAERNAKGDIIIERVATKRKIELQWKFLNKDQLTQVLNLVAPVFFQVTYVDPQTGGTRTGTFYCGDRKCGMLDFRKGVPRYKDVQFNLIER